MSTRLLPEQRSKSRRSARTRFLCGLALIGMLAAAVQACSVPVFRYALDHWTPDAYQLFVFHRGELSEADQSSLEANVLSKQAALANLRVRYVNLDEPLDDPIKQIWEHQNSEQLPLCVLQQPTMQPGLYRQVLASPLAEFNQMRVVDSPIRQQLTQKLVGGTSAVWLYLDSASGENDDELYASVETQLERLQGELKLPEIEPEDLPELATAPEDLKLQFAVLRIGRDDPAEAALIEMLLTTESDLRDPDLKDQPMLFPVFGRGRVLYSLVGKGINEGTIEDAARFLVGACQCTVKAENPGVDLLTPADWDQLVTPTGPIGVDVPLTGLAGFQADTQPDSALVSVSAPDTEDQPDGSVAGSAQDPEPSDDADTVELPAVRDRTPLAWSPWVIVAVLALVAGVVGCAAIPRS